MEDRCEREIEDLHRFFEGWLSGRVEDPDALGRCEAVLANGFELVDPDGGTVARETLLEKLRHSRGAHLGHTFRIRIEHCRARRVDENMFLATYEEWQEIGYTKRGRRSTAVLRIREDTPHGLEWLHVHETWIPR